MPLLLRSFILALLVILPVVCIQMYYIDGWLGNFCNDPVNIYNGNARCKKFFYKDMFLNLFCNITCNEGMVLIGSDNVTCRYPMQKKINWQQKLPKCLPPICKKMLVDKIKLTNAKTQSCTVGPKDNHITCEVICIDGSGTNGSNVIHCDERGLRKSHLICEEEAKYQGCRILKKNEEVTPNGKVRDCITNAKGRQDYCQIHCADGYSLHGNKKKPANCIFAKKEWKFAKCVSEEAKYQGCRILKNFEEVTPYGTIRDCITNAKGKQEYCKIHCAVGYTLLGNKKKPAKCVFGIAEWKFAKCVPEGNYCNDPVKVYNGNARCKKSIDDGKFSLFCNITCDEGMTLIGNDNVTCRYPRTEGFDWKKIIPLCLPPMCKKIVVDKIRITNAKTQNCTVRSKNNHITCEVICINGYVTNGSKHINCDKRGLGKSLPTCEVAKYQRCRILRDFEEVTPNGTVRDCITNADGWQDYCQIVCAAGYSLVGHKKTPAKCVFGIGEWKFAKCVYEPYNCTSLNVGGVYAKCSLSINKIKSQRWNCTLQCRRGFKEQLYWKLEGYYLISHDECKYKQRTKFLTCNIGGKWSSDDPLTCKQNFDCELPKFAGTHYNCSQKDFNSPYYCNIECEEGYHYRDNAPRMCQKNSRWSKRFHKCYKNFDCASWHSNTVDNYCPHDQDFSKSWYCDFWCLRNLVYYRGVYRNYCQKEGWSGDKLVCKVSE